MTTTSLVSAFKLSGIPPAKIGVPQIEFELKINNNGILEVFGLENAVSYTLLNITDINNE